MSEVVEKCTANGWKTPNWLVVVDFVVLLPSLLRRRRILLGLVGLDLVRSSSLGGDASFIDGGNDDDKLHLLVWWTQPRLIYSVVVWWSFPSSVISLINSSMITELLFSLLQDGNDDDDDDDGLSFSFENEGGGGNCWSPPTQDSSLYTAPSQPNSSSLLLYSGDTMVWQTKLYDKLKNTGFCEVVVACSVCRLGGFVCGSFASMPLLLWPGQPDIVWDILNYA